MSSLCAVAACCQQALALDYSSTSRLVMAAGSTGVYDNFNLNGSYSAPALGGGVLEVGSNANLTIKGPNIRIINRNTSSYNNSAVYIDSYTVNAKLVLGQVGVKNNITLQSTGSVLHINATSASGANNSSITINQLAGEDINLIQTGTTSYWAAAIHNRGPGARITLNGNVVITKEGTGGGQILAISHSDQSAVDGRGVVTTIVNGSLSVTGNANTDVWGLNSEQGGDGSIMKVTGDVTLNGMKNGIAVATGGIAHTTIGGRLVTNGITSQGAGIIVGDGSFVSLGGGADLDLSNSTRKDAMINIGMGSDSNQPQSIITDRLEGGSYNKSTKQWTGTQTQSQVGGLYNLVGNITTSTQTTSSSYIDLTMLGNSSFRGCTKVGLNTADSTHKDQWSKDNLTKYGNIYLDLQDSTHWYITEDSLMTNLTTGTASENDHVTLTFGGTNTKTSYTQLTLNEVALGAGTEVVFEMAAAQSLTLTDADSFQLVNANDYSSNVASSQIRFRLPRLASWRDEDDLLWGYVWDWSTFSSDGTLRIKKARVPEPTTAALSLLGLSAFLLRRRRA